MIADRQNRFAAAAFITVLTFMADGISAGESNAQQALAKRPSAIGFFFPEIAFYRQKLDSARLACKPRALEDFLQSVCRQPAPTAGPSGKLSESNARLLRAVLFVIAADEIEGLAPPIFDVLATVDDRQIVEAATYSLSSTVSADEMGKQLRSGLDKNMPETVKISCIPAAGCLPQTELEPLLIDLVSDDSALVQLEASVALAKRGIPAAIDSLVPLLESDSLEVRHRAGVALRRWTGEDYGFSAHLGAKERASAVARWRQYARTFDVSTLQRLQFPQFRNVLAVRGTTLFELGPDGTITHQQDGFNSLSEAVALDHGHRLVTDFMGRALYEYDDHWNEIARRTTPFQPRGSHRLPNGNTLVIGMSRFELLDPDGIASLPLATFPGRVNFTGSALAGKNRFLVTCNNTGMIAEYDLAGKPLWEMKVANFPRSVQQLNDGTLLVADFRQVAIYTPDGDITWQYELDGVQSAQQLPSGNFLLGHSSGLSMIDRLGEVLWELKRKAVPGYGFFAQVD